MAFQDLQTTDVEELTSDQDLSFTANSLLMQDYKLDSSGKLVEFKSYRTLLKLPYSKAGSGIKVRIGAEEATVVHVNGADYSVGPTQTQTFDFDATGELSFASEATGLCTPILRLSLSTMLADQFYEYQPDSDLHSYLSNVQGSDLSSGSSPLLDSKYNDHADDIASAIRNVAGLTQSGTFTTSATAVPQAVNFSIWKSVSHAASKVASSTVKTVSSAASSTASTVSSAATTATKAVTTEAAKVEKAASGTMEYVVQKSTNYAKGSVSFCVHVGGQLVKKAIDFEAKSIKDVISVVHQILAAVEIGVDKAIAWLSRMFGWDDIVNTHKVFQAMVLEALSAVKTMSKNLGSVLDKQIQSAKTSISTVFDKMIASTSKQALGCGEKTSSASSDAHSMWLHHKVKENWSASKTTTTTSSHAGVQSSIASVFTKLENKILSSDVQSSLKQAVTDLKNAFSDTSKLPDMLLSSILSLIKGLAEMALEVVDVIVVELCDLASEAISLLIDVLTFKIDIPFVSTLYKEISGGDSLTVLDVATLLLASFVTPVYKLAHSGKAPFSAADAKQFSSESKALSFSDSGTSTTQIYRDVYAVLQVLYGLNSAAVDVLAAGGTDSAGGYEGVLSVTLSIIDALNLLFDAPGDYTSDNFTNLKGFVSNFQGMSNLSENLLFLWNCFSICCDVASMVYEYKTGHGLQRVVSDGSWGPWVSMTFGVVAVGFSIMVYDTNMPSAVAAKDTVSEKAYLMEYAANVCEALMNCTKPMLLFDNPVTVAAVPVLDVVLSVVNGTLTALQPTSDGSS